jgi:hypothetical protein
MLKACAWQLSHTFKYGQQKPLRRQQHSQQFPCFKMVMVTWLAAALLCIIILTVHIKQLPASLDRQVPMNAP